MKGRKTKEQEHVVPLSSRCIEILSERLATRDDDGETYVFTSYKGTLCENALTDLIRNKINPQRLKDGLPAWVDPKLGNASVTTHGFRSSFSDWAYEQDRFGEDVIETALAHVGANKVKNAYKRGSQIERRRLLMQEWADHCSGTTPASNVVPLRGAA